MGLAAVAAVTAFLPVGAVAATSEPVSFSLVGLVGDREVTDERGTNKVVVEWSFGTFEFLDSTEPSICCNPSLQPTWLWNTKSGRGTISGTLRTQHYFLQSAWEGELKGRMTPSGGEGIAHLTEIYTGATVKATWTSPPVDPLTSDAIIFTFSGTLRQ